MLLSVASLRGGKGGQLPPSLPKTVSEIRPDPLRFIFEGWGYPPSISIFLQLVYYFLSEAAANATYLSPSSQNEMICIVGQHIQMEIVDQVKKARVFTVMMDETTDVSHKEQVAILVRYLHETDMTLL